MTQPLPYSLLTAKPSGGGAPPFDPTTLPNIISYWDPSVGISVTGSDLVTDWTDVITGTANDFAQGTDAARPLFIESGDLNGAPCVRTQDAARMLEAASVTGFANDDYVEVMLCVKRHDTFVNSRYILTMVGSGNDILVESRATGGLLKMGRLADAATQHILGDSTADTSGGGLFAFGLDGTNAHAEYGGAATTLSPIASVEGLETAYTSIRTGLGSGSALAEIYFLAIFASSSAGNPSAAARADGAMLAHWNTTTGLSMS